MGNKNDLAAVETPLQTVDQNIEIRHVFVYRLSCRLRPERIERTSRVALIPKDNYEVVFERAWTKETFTRARKARDALPEI
jgi:hypothetical protein